MPATRRDFLRAALGAPAVLSLGSAAPAFLRRAAAADPQPDADRVLVVVQLAGGNDGLNTVVPYDNDQYGRLRKTLRFTKGDVIPIGSDLGLHAQMPEMKRLLDDGHLVIVQGVGYPHQDGGHPESMRIWQTARLDARFCQAGWLGRAADAVAAEVSVPGAWVATGPRPLTINAARAILPSIRSIDDCRVRPAESLAETPAPLPADASPLLQEIARRSEAARRSAARVDEVVRSGERRQYPDTPLGASLRIVAQLVEANVGMRLFSTDAGGGGDIGGFDTHAGQKDNHAALLHQLSQAVAAFVDDLEARGLLDRVVLVTFSEFGRTILENGRRGTDHGAAAPMLMAGGRIRPGLIGEHPSMTELENGGPKHHTDFRRVYATLLDQWLGIDSQAVLGEKFEALSLFA
ncbi:MAG: DUF1501 domain-containing protein [Thermoguttaceae bacterium]